MIFPEFLQIGDKIAVTAPSGGITEEYDINRFSNAVKKLRDKGINVVFGESVFRNDIAGTSVNAKMRGDEFNCFIEDKSIKAILAASGGDFMNEMLKYVDYDLIRKNPKLIQGYSDITNITFSTTTLIDIATVYCNNFGNFGMDNWHKSIKDNFDILTGRKNSLESYDMYASSFTKYVTGTEGFTLTDPVYVSGYVNEEKKDKLCCSGRIIGGCADVISDLVGTRYENYLGFCDKYKKDGIILYLESFDGNSEKTIRLLWKLGEMGWYENVKAIIFGRPAFTSSDYDISYEDAVFRGLEGIKMAVVLGADIGHKAPQFSMINGAYANISVSAGRMTLTYEI